LAERKSGQRGKIKQIILSITFQSGNIVPYGYDDVSDNVTKEIPVGLGNFYDFIEILNQPAANEQGKPNYVRILHNSPIYPRLQLMGFFSAEGVQWTDSAENPYQINSWGASFIVFGSNPAIDSPVRLRQHFENFRMATLPPVPTAPVSQIVSTEGAAAQSEQADAQANPPPPPGVSLPTRGDIAEGAEVTSQQIERDMQNKTGNKDIKVKTTKAEIDQYGDRHAEWKIDDPNSDAKTQTISYDRSEGLGTDRDRVHYQEGLIGDDIPAYDNAAEDIGNDMKSTANSNNAKTKFRGW
jgi:hypothetical protein